MTVRYENLCAVPSVPKLPHYREYGELWHNAGRLQNKRNSFEDFIAAAEFLIRHNHTSARKIISLGASNGGMLVAGAMNMRPDLFGAVIAQVGFVHNFSSPCCSPMKST